jgi:hypothetical protein
VVLEAGALQHHATCARGCSASCAPRPTGPVPVVPEEGVLELARDRADERVSDELLGRSRVELHQSWPPERSELVVLLRVPRAPPPPGTCVRSAASYARTPPPGRCPGRARAAASSTGRRRARRRRAPGRLAMRARSASSSCQRKCSASSPASITSDSTSSLRPWNCASRGRRGSGTLSGPRAAEFVCATWSSKQPQDSSLLLPAVLLPAVPRHDSGARIGVQPAHLAAAHCRADQASAPLGSRALRKDSSTGCTLTGTEATSSELVNAVGSRRSALERPECRTHSTKSIPPTDRGNGDLLNLGRSLTIVALPLKTARASAVCV